jgi:hypothetical protein
MALGEEEGEHAGFLLCIVEEEGVLRGILFILVLYGLFA